MCLAVPAKVISLDGQSAVVERYGETLTVSLTMLPDPVELGDYLVIQAQSFAVDKVDEETALEAYRLFDEIIEAMSPAGGGAAS